MGHGAWGMGHGAWGRYEERSDEVPQSGRAGSIEHGAWGMEHGEDMRSVERRA